MASHLLWFIRGKIEEQGEREREKKKVLDVANMMVG
jgi:hypothetical protein